jgi:hypothetical protein
MGHPQGPRDLWGKRGILANGRVNLHEALCQLR